MYQSSRLVPQLSHNGLLLAPIWAKNQSKSAVTIFADFRTSFSRNIFRKIIFCISRNFAKLATLTTILIHFQLIVLEEHTRATEMNDLRRSFVRSNHYDDLRQKCQTTAFCQASIRLSYESYHNDLTSVSSSE